MESLFLRNAKNHSVDKLAIICYCKIDLVWGGMIFLKVDVMGIEFDNLTMQEFADRAAQMLQSHEKGYCVTPNAEIVYESIQDENFRSAINAASLVLPDGAGVILGAKILGTPLQEKVAGIEFGEEICKLLAKQKGRLYLLGGKPGIAEQAGDNLQKKYPGLTICGADHGYFKDEMAAVTRVNIAKPDAVFVCLGAKKQECFMRNHLADMNVSLMLGLGGSLDCYAGAAKRAPRWMINLSLEWLYRLLKEPKRLGRMMRLPKFMIVCFREKLRRKKNG